jgi:hypothetical protein
MQSTTARIVERELAAVHAAVGFSVEQALEVADSNERMLVNLGFGQSTLAADLADDQEDEDEDDEGTRVPAALGAGKQVACYLLPHFLQLCICSTYLICCRTV